MPNWLFNNSLNTLMCAFSIMPIKIKTLVGRFYNHGTFDILNIL